MLSAGRRRLLVTALWIPLAVLLLMLLDECLRGTPLTVELFETYASTMGIVAYIAFALLEMRLLRGKSEQQILARVWLGPLLFIPFYAASWMLFRLAKMLGGDASDVAPMLSWLVFIPCVLIVGYVVSGLTVALYRTVYS
ncbi:hypothetical protein SAMN05660489_01026 [Pseudomonas sp. LAMO17WK12:I10]|uniref:hypothetical protein n=1 Tax=unclassified Pseudomonas TaxID=196821 RepID=UPI000BD22CFC|nr:MULTISPECIES: hypothetical protein [unclassified Pseudomonas]PXX74888.1 hypothetical protein H160_01167 [Pseudomonas sp. LAMO17WK12:I9]SNY17369.1 hypothetical protein SAMN05660489_01026 [Pseudomonas sp. LAMO17WK12:I10]